MTQNTVRLPSRTLVYEGHTLVCVHPDASVDILRASILSGSPFNQFSGMPFDPVLNHGKYRSATEQDFRDFGIVFHPLYLEPTEVRCIGVTDEYVAKWRKICEDLKTPA